MPTAELKEHGVIGGINTTLDVTIIICAFAAIAWYNSIELNVLIWQTFKRKRGLYFWSVLAAIWGVIIFQLAFIMKFFQIWTNPYITVSVITVGWYCMVTGQSLVLYSRLHLVVRKDRTLRFVLIMIIANVFLLHVPTSVLGFGANSPAAVKYAYAYTVMEKIELTGFSVQEFIISALYVYETHRLLQPGKYFQKDKVRRVMRHLIYCNILIICMDITLLAIEFAGLYEIQITYKGALYSIKLKLEFVILNQLVELARPSRDRDTSYSGREVPLYALPDAGNGLGNNLNGTRGTAHESAHHNGSIAYAFSATRALPMEGELEEGVVLKQTEVNVTSAERYGSSLEVERRNGINEHGEILQIPPCTAAGIGIPDRKRLSRPSPTSSELEFADAGY